MRKRIIIFIALGIFFYLVGSQVDDYRLYQGSILAMYTIGLASIVLLTGYSGQVSLGHGAFMAVGGYSAALTLTTYDSPIWFVFLVAILSASFFGLIFGYAAARLSGPYLAGTTLTFAVGLPALANQFEFLGGEQGILFTVGSPPAWLGEEFSQDKWFFWVSAMLALVFIFFTANLLNSRFGRTWRALRGNAVAAELAGIETGSWKVLAFVVSSGLAGLAGAMLSMVLSLVSPGAFALTLSFSLVTGAVLAGVSSLPGVMLGALILVIVPEIADLVSRQLGDSEKIAAYLPGFIVSGLLVLSVIFTPNGPGENLRKHRHKKHA